MIRVAEKRWFHHFFMNYFCYFSNIIFGLRVKMLVTDSLFPYLQSWTKYLRQTLVFSIFQECFASIEKIFILGGRLSKRL